MVRQIKKHPNVLVLHEILIQYTNIILSLWLYLFLQGFTSHVFSFVDVQ